MQTLVEIASAMAYLHSLDILHSVSQLSGAWPKVGKNCCILLLQEEHPALHCLCVALPAEPLGNRSGRAFLLFKQSQLSPPRCPSFPRTSRHVCSRGRLQEEHQLLPAGPGRQQQVCSLASMSFLACTDKQSSALVPCLQHLRGQQQVCSPAGFSSLAHLEEHIRVPIPCLQDLNGNNILLVNNPGMDERPFSVKVGLPLTATVAAWCASGCLLPDSRDPGDRQSNDCDGALCCLPLRIHALCCLIAHPCSLFRRFQLVSAGVRFWSQPCFYWLHRHCHRNLWHCDPHAARAAV